MRTLRAIAALGLAFALAHVLFVVAGLSQPPAAPRDSPPASGAPPRFLGAASCAASACHNAGNPNQTRGSEYSTWLLADPHGARAFDVLSSDGSTDMVKRLYGEKRTDATKEELCLKCHAPHAPADQLHVTPSDPSPHREGVTCEACHGPSEHWRRDHFSRVWPDIATADKKARAFDLTKLPDSHGKKTDLATRVRRCASCHVGDEHREVDHDLIAAGHPPLFFEYAAYDALYKNKHWNDADSPDHAIRAWAVGQVAQTIAAVELTKVRASRANEVGRAWPEFSESSCFACHHELAGSNRKPTHGKARRVGTPPWGTWQTGTVQLLAVVPGPFRPATADAIVAALGDLRAEMERPYPLPAKVIAKATVLLPLLVPWLDAIAAPTAVTDENARALLLQLRDDITNDRSDASMQWDSVAQHYLAMAACARTPEQRSSLERIREVLRFRDPWQSPRGYDSADVRAAFSNFKP